MIKGRVTVLFFVLILSIVFVLMWFSNNHQFLSFSDGAKFADIARNIKNGQGYGSTFSFFTDSAFQLISEGLFSARWIPPLMPLSILGSFFLFGVGDFAVYLNNTGIFYLKCYANINGLKKEVYSRRFKSMSLPKEHLTVSMKENGEISKEMLINAGKIVAQMYFMNMDIVFNIVGFNLSTIDENGNYIENYSKSSKLTEVQKEQIKNLKPGDKVYFENILGETFDGRLRNLGKMMFKIK